MNDIYFKENIKKRGLKNIKELEEHGTRPRSKKQIIAIALHVARVKKKKKK